MTSYFDIPPLKSYIERIGAEELNFKKFIVKIYHGSHYYHEKCLIRINAEGDIHCTNPEYAPSDIEAAEIKAALLRVNFPRCIKATEGEYTILKERLGPTAMLYAFYDRTDGMIIMLQERVVIEGKKNYLPWTYWSDGQWRKMEPEGNLPFWKPKERTDKSLSIMIHEGAKTAHFVHQLVNDPERVSELMQHPWADDLRRFEHWGMIGGALAPQRTDYRELLRERTEEVVYVCDNDWPGKTALKTVSRCYGRKLKGVMFDERWPAAWDLADPMPPHMFGEDGKWKGPTLLKQTQLATLATEQVELPSGRMGQTIRTEFAEEWVHCVSPEVFIHLDWPNKILTASEFNHTVRPFSHVDDTARLLKQEAANRSAMLEYSPAIHPGIYNDTSGNRYINTHTPSHIQPLEGDPAPWIDFMSKLIPDQHDLIEMLRWVATMIHRPDIKMVYGLLLVSETQGIGKSTLGGENPCAFTRKRQRQLPERKRHRRKQLQLLGCT
jgi:hypothetical protein